ncbi:SixA phosphatase family protein [Phenylobacterium immobile]|uniref:SixA phosphatase family protein n=1 Tax=Phenylobacterium immobile TaxID=21 RepID=UPI001FDED40A|nr:histidine phosphatase family protein [Phenylobacterium immobile]
MRRGFAGRAGVAMEVDPYGAGRDGSEMNRLILMRHGQAENRATGGDSARRLTAIGAGAAAETAHQLADAGYAPDRVLVSSAQRTRETWTAAQPAFPGAKVEFEAALYNADAETVLDAAEAAEAACVMVVGHNPGIHDAAMRLLVKDPTPAAAAARLVSGFPTSTAAVFRLNPDGTTTVEAVILGEARG